MSFDANETAIDQIVATCNGDMRGALKALLLVNEQLEKRHPGPAYQSCTTMGAIGRASSKK